MRVVIADRTIHLAHDLHAGNALAGRLQAYHNIGNFFAHRCRTRGLAVGAAEHGHLGINMRHIAQHQHQSVELRQQHDAARCAQLQCVAGVIDVFAGAGEMHKFSGSQ